jgi:hypothetical protein
VTCAANICMHLPKEVLGDLTGVLDQVCVLVSSLEWAWVQIPEVTEGKEASADHASAWAARETEALTSLLWNATRHVPMLQKNHLQLILGLARATSRSHEVCLCVCFETLESSIVPRNPLSPSL